MAIKVSNTEVVSDNRRGAFTMVNPGVTTDASRPATPEVGDMVYDSDEKTLYIWKGSDWEKA